MEKQYVYIIMDENDEYDFTTKGAYTTLENAVEGLKNMINEFFENPEFELEFGSNYKDMIFDYEITIPDEGEWIAVNIYRVPLI